MASGSYYEAYYDCLEISKLLHAKKALGRHDLGLLSGLCEMIYKYEEGEVEGRYQSKPMLWIGIYIAVASLFCILLMVADLFHGFRNRKLWFPSKYFTLNTASITVMTIAMKLPVDLNSQMPGFIDQWAKLGSMTFMCTMMANLMPSLASMDNRELFANVAGMIILVITMIVNVLIQLGTGVVEDKYIITVYTNIGAMISLLVLVVSSALTIPTSKRILESKYQVVHKTTSNDVHPPHAQMVSTEELTKRLRKYWVMAETCSPQFVMITTPLCSVAGIICVTTTILHFIILVFIIIHAKRLNLASKSDYRWSMSVIYITQSIGIVVGTIAPIFRSFATLSFKPSIKWIKKNTKVWKVEEYWTQKLSEWKEIPLPSPFGGHVSKAFVYHLYNLILNLCIICQKVVVVSCKVIGVISLGTVIVGVFSVCYLKSLTGKLFPMLGASNDEVIDVVEQNDANQDIGNYVLRLQDEMELGTRTLKRISNSANRSIQKASKQLPSNLLKLIEKFTGFEGVVNFDSDHILPLLWYKFPNCWSLPVVTLTCVAITLPNISNDIIGSLFSSVSEGLSYTFLVEESLNNTGEYRKIHKSTMALWQGVEVNYKWLGYTLRRSAYKDKNMKEILEWFADKSEEIVVEMNKHNNQELYDNSFERLIVANSMYRITKTIMVNYSNDIECNREEKLFGLLSSMIIDILVACFTNLPRVIAMKCHECTIEKREASVRAATKLLGSTKNIIEKLHVCEIPSLDPEKMAFIDEWRVHLKHSVP